MFLHAKKRSVMSVKENQIVVCRLSGSVRLCVRFDNETTVGDVARIEFGEEGAV